MSGAGNRCPGNRHHWQWPLRRQPRQQRQRLRQRHCCAPPQWSRTRRRRRKFSALRAWTIWIHAAFVRRRCCQMLRSHWRRRSACAAAAATAANWMWESWAPIVSSRRCRHSMALLALPDCCGPAVATISVSSQNCLIGSLCGRFWRYGRGRCVVAHARVTFTNSHLQCARVFLFPFFFRFFFLLLFINIIFFLIRFSFVLYTPAYRCFASSLLFQLEFPLQGATTIKIKKIEHKCFALELIKMLPAVK